ncbi:MAG TPA: MlaD family protein [Thermoanaerobaculia bacterium]|nr:MlaD family protein [Thermoanaerobaculia bacterium]
MPETGNAKNTERAATRAAKVGGLVLAALAVLAAAIFLIGKENNLFSPKNHYFVDLKSVSGIKPGNPVQLDGVAVGAVHKVILPRDPAKKFIRVWMAVDRRYGARVRADSLVRIRTLGLLGDKFLELNSGSPTLPEVPDEGAIRAAPMTDVDALIASGEDVMDNVSTISVQLKNILGRVDRGEGLVGELTTDSPASRRLKTQVFETLDTIERVAQKVDSGPGPLPRLLNDRALADRLAQSVDNLNGVLDAAAHGDGLLPGLLNDPATRADYDATLSSVKQVAADLQKFSGELNNGQGLLPRLVHDEAYGREITGRVQKIVEQLNEVSDKLSHGGGTAAKLINDPQIYDSVNDILVGVNDSWMLRWLIRNRQKAGIKHRYHAAQEEMKKETGAEPETAPPSASHEPNAANAADATPAPPQSTEPAQGDPEGGL